MAASTDCGAHFTTYRSLRAAQANTVSTMLASGASQQLSLVVFNDWSAQAVRLALVCLIHTSWY